MKNILALLLAVAPALAYAAGNSYIIPTLEIVTESTPSDADIVFDSTVTFNGIVYFGTQTVIPSGLAAVETLSLIQGDGTIGDPIHITDYATSVGVSTQAIQDAVDALGLSTDVEFLAVGVSTEALAQALVDHEALSNIHHTPTVNTNAFTECGAGQYYSGTGTCDTIDTTVVSLAPISGDGSIGDPVALDDDGVTSAKIADGAVTTIKLSQQYLPLAGGTLSGDLDSGDNNITNVANLLIGTNTISSNSTFVLQGETNQTTRVRLTRFSDDINSTDFITEKGRGTGLAPVTVQDGDHVLQLRGGGWDGDQFRNAAEIRYSINGTPANNVMPGKISFRTNTGGGGPTTQTELLSTGDWDYLGHDLENIGNYPSLVTQLDDIAVSTSTPLNFLPLSGGTMAGNVIFTSGFIRLPAGEPLQWKTFPGGNNVSVMNMYFDSFLIGQAATGGIPNPSAHARIIFGVNTKVGIATMTASGLDVDGAVTAISFDGDGSALTNLGKVDKAGDTMTGALILPTGTCSSNPSLRLDGGNAFKTGLCGGTGANGSLKFVAAGGIRLTIAGASIFTGGQTFTANAIVSNSGVDADSVAGYTLDGAGALDRLVNDLFIGRDFNEINLLTNTDAQGFNIVNVGSGSFIGPVSKGNQYLQVYDSAGGTNIDDSFTAIPWGSQTVVDSLYTHSTSVDNATVTINTSGLYKLTAVVAAEDASNDNSNIDVRIIINGVQPSATSEVSCHGRKPAESIYTSCVFPPTIIAFTAADTVVIEARMAKPGTDWDTVAGRSWFNLELLRE